MSSLDNFESLKNHPLPDWYRKAKLGIFIHWGLYSVPAFAPSGEHYAERYLKGELGYANSPYAEWYLNSLRISGSPTQRYHLEKYGKDFAYEEFAAVFNQQLNAWDPAAMADSFARAGAGYVVLVSKHHDGFLMWNSRQHNPKRPDYQVRRDIAGELTQAVSQRGMKMGFYYSSLLDWTFTKRPITTDAELVAGSNISRRYRDYALAHWRELIDRYQPWILWSDIGYPPDKRLPELFADFYEQQPEGVINDRWFQLPPTLFNPLGRAWLTRRLKQMERVFPPVAHCDFLTAEYASFEGIQEKKWEACRGIGNSFGYNQLEGEGDYLEPLDAVRLLAEVVSKNGNLLLNVGPRADGSLPAEQARVLEGLGEWLRLNGEAIYATRPWIRHKDDLQGEAEVYYTAKADQVYAIVTRMPGDGRLRLPAGLEGSYDLVETGQSLDVEAQGDWVRIRLPDSVPAQAVPVIRMRR